MKRLLIAIGVFAALNAYVLANVIGFSGWGGAHAGAVCAAGALVFLLELAGPILYRVVQPGLRPGTAADKGFSALIWLSYAAIGICSCLIVYTMLGDILALLCHAAGAGRAFDRAFVPALGAVTAVTAVIGIGQIAAGPRVAGVDIPLANLPAGFDGFRIAQVSDLHIGPTIGRRYAARVVRMVNALKPDLIALTGDLVDGPVARVRAELFPIAGLRARHGTFYVTGNHEYYWGIGRWLEELRALGLRILANEHEVIRHGNDAIVLAGITDHSTRNWPDGTGSDPTRALAGAPTGVPRILLAHQPVSFQAAEPAGVDLQLSGHTHGGQYFPFSLLIRFFQRYYKGLNRHGRMWLYVNPGTGYWGPPLRTFVPPEITLITLRSAA